MNRNHTKAQVGWDLFMSLDPHPTREMINHELEAQGLPGIADRTYRHYCELAGAGLRAYRPINDFDMWRKHKRGGDSSSN